MNSLRAAKITTLVEQSLRGTEEMSATFEKPEDQSCWVQFTATHLTAAYKSLSPADDALQRLGRCTVLDWVPGRSVKIQLHSRRPVIIGAWIDAYFTEFLGYKNAPLTMSLGDLYA